MPYPLMFACNGDVFARLNHDATWSVRWDRVLDIAFTKPDSRQRVLQAYAWMMHAAKDNFLSTAWDVSERLSDKWTHYEAIIDRTSVEPSPGQWLSTITHNTKIIARINGDGSWSVLWDEVLEVARWKDFDYKATALIGICRLLQAAKDRFLLAPWDEEEEE